MKEQNEYHHDDKPINNKGVINVRKLAALDIVFHGMKMIMVEFLAAVLVCAGLAVLLLFFISSHTLSNTLLGLYFLGVALNYLPLLSYALLIRTRDQAANVAERELKDVDHYGRRYSLQSILLILIPYALALLALSQLAARRSHS
ncbi:hypothetical protein [Tengunoibacter tsumagoiensis]|uniref:Uncharacterized protein n=1 Tax=Tengunoibacter tsumagoiensis TaxID=2014871 RepID=A0A402A6X6_9CHLR|nr:hypothetical protein [Tengunoibacter tsumagoiensis]GCE14868.1 hypothetical protein KTT_47270 [Tengunoibacter tsumagoiensis]